ncbi:MAG: GntR family transcriptional regulator [Desulfuromusa sp.]
MSNKTLRMQAYKWLKKKIITLEFPMGSPLLESDLCQETGLGRTPVREAVQQLASEGLISIRPRKGIFVSDINFLDFDNLIEARIMLETHVIRRVADTITPKQSEKLRMLFVDVPDLIDKGDINGLLVIERSFHQSLVSLLENPYLDSIAERIYDLVERTWQLSFRKRSKSDLARTLNDHLVILEELEKGDVNAAEKVTLDHILNFRSKVFRQPEV